MTANSNVLNEECYESCVICQECDQLVFVGNLPPGNRASCPRCGFVLSRAHANAVDRMLIFAITAVVCLMMSGLFDFVQMAVQGQERKMTLLETVRGLFALNELTLAVFMLVVIVGLPAMFIGLIGWLTIALKLQQVSPQIITVLRIIGYLRFWNMAEIFFLGILISMIKIASMAHVSVGFSFWAYGMFNLFLIAAMMHIDKVQLTRAIKRIVRQKQGISNGV